MQSCASNLSELAKLTESKFYVLMSANHSSGGFSGARGTHPQSNCFYFHAVFGKNYTK